MLISPFSIICSSEDNQSSCGGSAHFRRIAFFRDTSIFDGRCSSEAPCSFVGVALFGRPNALWRLRVLWGGSHVSWETHRFSQAHLVLKALRYLSAPRLSKHTALLMPISLWAHCSLKTKHFFGSPVLFGKPSVFREAHCSFEVYRSLYAHCFCRPFILWRSSVLW